MTAVAVVGLAMALVAALLPPGGAAAAEGEAPLLIIHTPAVLLVDHPRNVATGMLYVKNRSPRPVPLLLFARDFTAASTGKPVGATTRFIPEGGTEGSAVHEEAALAPGRSVALRIEVTNLWEAGESAAPLYNHDVQVGTLRAVKDRVPFAVTVQGTGDEAGVLRLERGRPAHLVLRNEDAMTYRADWEVVVGDRVARGAGPVELAPSGTATLALPVVDGWFTAPIEGFFKDETKDARLRLRLQAPAHVATPSAGERIIPLRAQLAYWPAAWRMSVSTVVVFLALLAGGLCSLMLSQWFPNRLRRLDLEERLDGIAARVRNLSSRIDSSLRIVVRVERYRLLRLSGSRYAFSPEMTGVLAACAQAADRLESKVTVLERIDAVGRDLRMLRSTAAPTLADGVEARLRQAAERLRSPQSSDTELAEASALVTEAAGRLSLLGQADEVFAKAVAERFDDLHDALATGGVDRKHPKCEALALRLGALFDFLDGTRPDAATLRPAGYYDCDTKLLRLMLVRDYVRLYAEQAPDVRARLEAGPEDEFLDLLSGSTWDSYVAARLTLREMREDLYPEDVERAIVEERVRVVAQPPDPRPHQAVELSALFSEDRINASGARDEYVCEWSFDHADSSGRPASWLETGWTVHHFFPKPGDYKVTATFRTRDGKPVADQTNTIRVIAADVTVGSDDTAWFGNRTRIEAVRFGIVLVATVLGLLGGARDQLMKLDVAAGLVAVFLIGFTADAVKNILVERGPGPAPDVARK
jgi:hypothetical protein